MYNTRSNSNPFVTMVDKALTGEANELVKLIIANGSCVHILFCNNCPVEDGCHTRWEVGTSKYVTVLAEFGKEALFRNTYQRAVAKYIELSGKEELLKVLI